MRFLDSPDLARVVTAEAGALGGDQQLYLL
jgi:hypothetical protein